jgi:hypothetical protein
VSGTSSVEIRRDVTAPSVSWHGDIADGVLFVFGALPEVPTCTAEDTTSGPAGCTVSGYSTAVGTHTLTATTADQAGNVRHETRGYTVAPWELRGFGTPVAMGEVNSVKAGATVPLKFEVFAGSTELTSTSSVTGLSTTRIACDTSAPADEIDTAASGAAGLRYDDGAGQFVFNWRSPRTPGACYQVSVATEDGSTLTAAFLLR